MVLLIISLGHILKYMVKIKFFTHKKTSFDGLFSAGPTSLQFIPAGGRDFQVSFKFH